MPEVQTTGWGSRLVTSIIGALIGIVLFLVSFPLLLWNESRAVNMARTLEEGAAACLDVKADKIDPSIDGRLIHTSGDATTDETLKDEQFGVSDKAIKLTRTAEIYQYVEHSKQETKKKLGGGQETITHYNHDEEWVKAPVNSNSFHPDDNGVKPMNVGSLPYQDVSKTAKEVKLGAFDLTVAQVGRIGAGAARKVTAAEYAALPDELKSKLKLRDGVLYQPYKQSKAGDKPDKPDDGTKPADEASEPQIGDVRVTFLVLKSPQPVSILAAQKGDSFAPWESKAGGKTIDDLRPGILSKDAMFTALENENAMLTWLLRLGGFALMAVGIFLVLKPFAVFADVLPFLGDMVSAVLAVVAAIIALPLALITIALSWVFVRPMLGIPLLIGGVLMMIGAFVVFWRIRSAKVAAKKLAAAK